MFFCSSSDGDLATFSKADILRGIITEKLSIATRDILAVVERTVADYEEEASGFRRRIARQERQLELLQPRVHLHRLRKFSAADFSGFDCRSNSVFIPEEEPEPRGSEELVMSEPPKKELPSPPPGIKDSVRLNFPQENNEDDDDDGGGFDEEQVQFSAGSRERSNDPDFEIPSRSMSHRPPRHKVRPRTAWSGSSPTHLNLRFRFMKNPNVDVFRPSCMKNTLVQDLHFPRSLQESEFVDLLRSSFPPLAGRHKAFEFYTVNRDRKLQKLPLKSMTPREIIRSIKSNAPRATVLFIKLKSPEAEKKSEETPEEKPKGASEEIKENTEEEHLEENTEEENTEEEHLEENIEEEHLEENTEEEHLEENTEEEHLEDNNEDLEDSHVSTGKDEPSSCDAEADEVDDAGPSSSSGPHGFREESGFRDSPEHHKESEVNDVDQNDASAKDPEWKLESKQQKEVKKAESPGERRKKRACKVCGCWYKSLGGLIKHVWTHTNEPQRLCGICGDAFESSEELKEHLRSHDEVYKCEECGKSFVKLQLFKRHLAMHSLNMDIQCEVCGKKFGSKYTLNLHSWSHAEELPYKCDLCEKAFGLKSLLKAHRRNHDENQCHLCSKSLSTSRALARHIMSHSENRNFACEVCGKRFKTPNCLNIHKKVHMDRERSFLCHICCKAFYCNGTLKVHMKTHSSEKPFVCQDCGKRFLNKGNLNIHQRLHTGERPYVCSHCGRRFKLKSTLSRHVRNHLGIKSFTCSVCGKTGSRQEHLKVHMRTHNGDRPYKCSICDKAFTQSHCLKTHMMKHHAGQNQNRFGP